MKNIVITILLLSVFSCQEKKHENNSEISNIKEEKIEKKNEVYISINDTINSFSTNLFLDEMQDKPDLLYLGQKVGKSSIIIPTDSSIEIKGGAPWLSFFYDKKFEKGDSLLINVENIRVNQSQKVEYPTFTILNSTKSWSETNFDYLLYKDNINKKAIVIDDKGNFQKNKYDSEEIYKNSIIILDSLKSINSISNKFYTRTKINQKLKYTTNKIREAKNKNLELDIESLGIKLNEEELFNHKEYVSFLRALVLYKYFNKDKRVLNSVQFDFINNQVTFLNEPAKLLLLNSYLRGIYIFEKSKFNKYLTKFYAINRNEAFKNKWQSVVDKQKLNSKKLNATNRNIGILTNLVNDNELTFEEVLSKHKGKVVLVDFWASWCAPCRKEIPFLKDLKSKFSENELKVIEISIDKDYSAWVRASKLENLSKEEDNYIIENWEKSSLYKNYKIKTIPRYLVFDKNGKIIDDDAPRPSETELIKLIKASI